VADGRTPFEVSLVTPEGAAYEGEAEMIIVPGAAGEIGVLARHAPLVALLKAGSTRVHTGGEVREYATGPGFFKVEQNRAIALVDDAVLASEIDADKARRLLDEAREALEKLDRDEGAGGDRWQLEQRVRHAENLVEVRR
jgi:F-type H+-transporting ATPase subunit epsilon